MIKIIIIPVIKIMWARRKGNDKVEEKFYYIYLSEFI